MGILISVFACRLTNTCEKNQHTNVELTVDTGDISSSLIEHEYSVRRQRLNEGQNLDQVRSPRRNREGREREREGGREIALQKSFL